MGPHLRISQLFCLRLCLCLYLYLCLVSRMLTVKFHQLLIVGSSSSGAPIGLIVIVVEVLAGITGHLLFLVHVRLFRLADEVTKPADTSACARCMGTVVWGAS